MRRERERETRNGQEGNKLCEGHNKGRRDVLETCFQATDLDVDHSLPCLLVRTLVASTHKACLYAIRGLRRVVKERVAQEAHTLHAQLRTRARAQTCFKLPAVPSLCPLGYCPIRTDLTDARSEHSGWHLRPLAGRLNGFCFVYHNRSMLNNDRLMISGY